ncbi:hypothetical protein EXN66_Car009222 [Channa argus]|uniref:Uncharacterized protein n=1 Tax=Channa argus TaxID=215402 RepID=A0A6G1PU77_CHAAH|nr:hypothetical protein EXN66_Car009222 [Channa argus]
MITNSCNLVFRRGGFTKLCLSRQHLSRSPVLRGLEFFEIVSLKGIWKLEIHPPLRSTHSLPGLPPYYGPGPLHLPPVDTSPIISLPFLQVAHPHRISSISTLPGPYSFLPHKNLASPLDSARLPTHSNYSSPPYSESEDLHLHPVLPSIIF